MSAHSLRNTCTSTGTSLVSINYPLITHTLHQQQNDYPMMRCHQQPQQQYFQCQRKQKKRIKDERKKKEEQEKQVKKNDVKIFSPFFLMLHLQSSSSNWLKKKKKKKINHLTNDEIDDSFLSGKADDNQHFWVLQECTFSVSDS